ncbi:hypothetical protein AB1N83_003039 [Pleurotus pulmonarius]
MLLSTRWMFPGLVQTHRIPPPWSIITIRTSTSASGNTAASRPDQSITLALTAQPPFSYSMPTAQDSYPLGPPLGFSNAPTSRFMSSNFPIALGIPHIEVAVFGTYIAGLGFMLWTPVIYDVLGNMVSGGRTRTKQNQIPEARLNEHTLPAFHKRACGGSTMAWGRKACCSTLAQHGQTPHPLPWTSTIDGYRSPPGKAKRRATWLNSEQCYGFVLQVFQGSIKTS